MKLSLLMPYRSRALHLKNTLEWFERTVALNKEVELILVECDIESTFDTNQIKSPNIKYFFQQGDGVFHKSKLLNFAFSKSSGEFVVPYDVDLIPLDYSFQKHILLSEKNRGLLFTGYRLMCMKEYIDLDNIAEECSRAGHAAEDSSFHFLKSQLINGDRFGVLPFFERKRIESIGGWDENFIGWGAEDNDIIERYIQKDIFLVRSPDLVYLHLHHEKTEGWNESFYTQNNLKHYYSKKGIEMEF